MAEKWHAGRTVGRTIYRGDGPDDLIGIMDTRELAAEVVADHNRELDANTRPFPGKAVRGVVRRIIAGEGVLSSDVPTLLAALLAAERRNARREAVLSHYVEHAEYCNTEGRPLYLAACPTCQGIMKEAKTALEESRD